MSTKKKTRAAPATFHLDRRAHSIAASDPGDDDRLLSTTQVATWLGVSNQWVELRRVRGDGPPFEKLGPRCVRYHVGKVKAWLTARTRTSTREAA